MNLSKNTLILVYIYTYVCVCVCIYTYTGAVNSFKGLLA